MCENIIKTSILRVGIFIDMDLAKNKKSAGADSIPEEHCGIKEKSVCVKNDCKIH